VQGLRGGPAPHGPGHRRIALSQAGLRAGFGIGLRRTLQQQLRGARAEPRLRLRRYSLRLRTAPRLPKDSCWVEPSSKRCIVLLAAREDGCDGRREDLSVLDRADGCGAGRSGGHQPVGGHPAQLVDGLRVDLRLLTQAVAPGNGQAAQRQRTLVVEQGTAEAHTARLSSPRRLSAGAIAGAGTVSNLSRQAGSACIAGRRVIEKIDQGEIRTDFMQLGDSVRMQAAFDDGRPGPFDAIEQRVAAARRSRP
jgi:hypothetical protein